VSAREPAPAVDGYSLHSLESLGHDPIGMVVVRVTDDWRRLTLPHIVDSIADDEPFTRCGRRLEKRPGTVFRYAPTSPIPTCRQCRP
jgi:hypothetical protein